jgi:hypothetical protein
LLGDTLIGFLISPLDQAMLPLHPFAVIVTVSPKLMVTEAEILGIEEEQVLGGAEKTNVVELLSEPQAFVIVHVTVYVPDSFGLMLSFSIPVFQNIVPPVQPTTFKTALVWVIEITGATGIVHPSLVIVISLLTIVWLIYSYWNKRLK